MIFSSPIFLFAFLPVVLLAINLVPKKFQNALLLIFSLLFYYWGEGLYILLLLLSVAINYTVALLFETKGLNRKLMLGIGVLLNLSFLLHFKYAHWFLTEVNHFFGTNIQTSATHLPIGISFFTFQGMSYLIDVYRKWSEPQRNIARLALFISFFPQLIAGPIIRYHHLESQLAERTIYSARSVSGVKRFIEGLIKKLVFADGFGRVCDQIFSMGAGELSFSLAWMSSICFVYQVYLDFAAYSDMAIGLGRMFGFEIRENFNYPLREKSIRSFWSKWHMSLIQWFRDYPYYALKRGKLHWTGENFRLMTIFLLTGLWHGANWTFVLWGFTHGLLVVLETGRWGKILNKLPVFVRSFYVYFFVGYSGILFRGRDIEQVWMYTKAMFGFGSAELGASFFYFFNAEVLTLFVLAVLGGFGVFLKLKEHSLKLIGLSEESHSYNILEFFWYAALMVLALVVLSNNTYNPFIYFNF